MNEPNPNKSEIVTTTEQARPDAGAAAPADSVKREEVKVTMPNREAHSFAGPKAKADGFGHSGGQRDGHHRLSGVKGAHRIGKK